jgi:hypothetical protein
LTEKSKLDKLSEDIASNICKENDTRFHGKPLQHDTLSVVLNYFDSISTAFEQYILLQIIRRHSIRVSRKVNSTFYFKENRFNSSYGKILLKYTSFTVITINNS